jgi:hypothetical protein
MKFELLAQHYCSRQPGGQSEVLGRGEIIELAVDALPGRDMRPLDDGARYAMRVLNREGVPVPRQDQRDQLS